MTMKAKALSLASKGYRVFPLIPGAKAPLISTSDGGRGCWDGTTDVDQINAWWDETPDANIGIHPPSEVTVIDIDRKDPDKDGLISISELMTEAGMIAGEEEPASRVDTPTGGQHWYFNVGDTGKWGNRVGVLPGVDIRSEGGFLVAPGSVIDGTEYEGTLPACAELPVITGPLTTLRGLKKEKAENASEAVVELDLDRNVAKAEMWLGLREPAVEGDGGDEHTYVTAVRLREMGLSADKTLELMLDWNDRCEPPWDFDDLKEKVDNAYRYALEPAGAGAASSQRDALLASVTNEQRAEVSAVRDRAAREQQSAFEARFRTYEIDDALAPTEWIVGGVIPQGSIFELIGPEGQFKTFLAISMATSLLLGEDWHGHEVKSPRPVVWVTTEGAKGIPKRLAADLIRRKHEMRTELPTWRLYPGMPNFGDLEEAEGFGCVVRDICGEGAVVVIDTLAIAIAHAGFGENNNDELTLLYEGFKLLRDTTGGSVLVIRHTGKDVSKGGRGASAASASGDGSLLISSDIDDRVMTIRGGKGARDESGLRAPMQLEGRVIQLAPDVTSLAFDKVAYKPSREQRTNDFRVSMVKDILREAGVPMTAKALADEMARRSDAEEDSEVRRNIGQFLNNATKDGKGAAKELRPWRFKDGTKWMWAEPEESEPVTLDLTGL